MILCVEIVFKEWELLGSHNSRRISSTTLSIVHIFAMLAFHALPINNEWNILNKKKKTCKDFSFNIDKECVCFSFFLSAIAWEYLCQRIYFFI